jgi:hypothetical protein
MSHVSQQILGRWRYWLPILQGVLALALLVLAKYQQNKYDDWLVSTYPRAFEIDNAYNPPARLIALLICGPGILIPTGTQPYDPTAQVAHGLSIFSVMLFWFVLGRLLGQKESDRKSVIRGLGRAALYVALFLFLVQFGWILVSNIRQVLQFPMSFHYLSLYGLRARILMDFIGVTWLAALSAFSVWQFVASLKGTIPGLRH